jgi:pseudouridine-5'-phosphate glycosidase
MGIGLAGSVLVANPVPAGEAVDREEMEVYIRQALDEAAQQNIRGKELTPFLLQYIATHTKRRKPSDQYRSHT